MALPDINITQFLDLIEGSKITPDDNAADIEVKQRKLEALKQQAHDKPHLLKKVGSPTPKSKYSSPRSTTALMAAFNDNHGEAARILLEAGADMRQVVEYSTDRDGRVLKRNAFDQYLDGYRRDYDQVRQHKYPKSFVEADEILPLIFGYLEGLSPDERHAMFEKASDGKHYLLQLGELDKNGVFDDKGDERPSLFERMAPLGASLDVIPSEDRPAALSRILSSNVYKGGTGFFHFLKQHVQSLEGGEQLWRSMFEPGVLVSSLNSISRIRAGDQNPKKKIENSFDQLRAMIDEVPDENLHTLFQGKKEGEHVGGGPMDRLVDHIITHRKYASATTFAEYLAGKLEVYFDKVYPTLDEAQKKHVDKVCQKEFGSFYSYRIPNRELNPVYKIFRRQVERQLSDGIPDEPYYAPSPKDITGAAIRYSNAYERGINIQEALVEIHRDNYFPGRVVLKAEERNKILDDIACWDKDLPANARGYESANLDMQIARRVSAKYDEMQVNEKAAKATKDSKIIAETKDKYAPYQDGWNNLYSDKNLRFLTEHLHNDSDFRNHVSFDEMVTFFTALGFYIGKADYDSELDQLGQKCFEDIVLHAEKKHISLMDSLQFFQEHYPRQEILNVKDTFNEISRYIYQPTFVIQARKAGMSEALISEQLLGNRGSEYTIKNSFLKDLSFRQILDNSIYWHMRRAGIVGPAPKDAETGEPITEAVRKHPLRVGWNPLFKGDVEFEVSKKKYRLSAATSSEELQHYGSYCRTCVGGEGFSMDCMAGRQQVYGLFEIDADTGEAKQKGYARLRVSRSADPKAFEQQLKVQDNKGDAEVSRRFAEGVGMAINRRTAIQMDYTTGFGNQTPPWLQRVMDTGLKQFGRVALQKGKDGRLTLPQKEKEDEEPVLTTPEEMLGLDEVNHAEALRIFKLLEKTCAAVDRNEDGHAVDADTGEVITNVAGLHEGDRRVRIDEKASFFKDFQDHRNTVPGYSKMDALQQFAVYTGLDKSIESSIHWAKKHAADKAAKDDGNQRRYGMTADVSFDTTQPRVPSTNDRYYTDIREIQTLINRKLMQHSNRGNSIPQIFGNISVDDTLEAVQAFAKAYPNEVKIESKKYAPDETKINVRIDGWPELNLGIIASHIVAKRGLSVPFLEWKSGKDIAYMPENIRWLKDCKPLSEMDAIESFVNDQLGSALGVTAFQAEGSSKTFVALRPTSMEDMEVAINFVQNSKTFPALIWGIPPKDAREEHGDARPQWLVTPQFQKELETLPEGKFYRIDPPDRVQVKTPPLKIGEDRTLEFARHA